MIIKIITPREIELKITNARSQKLTQGSEIWLEGKLIVMLSKRSKWHSMITSYSVSPQQYLYVDEMLTGPFKKGVNFLYAKRNAA
jgi:ligand-binding SRPBCC domain-containing protein